MWWTWITCARPDINNCRGKAKHQNAQEEQASGVHLSVSVRCRAKNGLRQNKGGILSRNNLLVELAELCREVLELLHIYI